MFCGNFELEKFFVFFYELEKFSVVVCYLMILLFEVKILDGELFVKDKIWIGFVNVEEDYVD